MITLAPSRREPLGVRGALAARAAGDERHPSREPAHRATGRPRGAVERLVARLASARSRSRRTMSIRAVGRLDLGEVRRERGAPRRVEPEHARDQLGLRGVDRELRAARRREADEVQVLGADGQRQAGGAQRHAVALADQAPGRGTAASP